MLCSIYLGIKRGSGSKYTLSRYTDPHVCTYLCMNCLLMYVFMYICAFARDGCEPGEDGNIPLRFL